MVLFEVDSTVTDSRFVRNGGNPAPPIDIVVPETSGDLVRCPIFAAPDPENYGMSGWPTGLSGL
jgi:hypothetical protein